MLTNDRQRQHRSVFQTSKMKDIFKSSTSGTLSPLTMATTSSGYSTGGSSTSTAAISLLKKSTSSSIGLKTQFPQQQEQQQQRRASSKTKPKGLQHLFSKLKNLLLSPRNKHARIMRPITSRRISSTNILRQYHQQSTLYDVLPSSMATSKTISLPFTYYQPSPIRQSRTNFEQISAWLNHTEEVTEVTHKKHSIPYSRQHCKATMSSLSSVDTDQPEITVVMKQTSTNIQPPKRSSSLVTTKQTRPIIEQQPSQRSSSPTLSFSSSILTKGMSERITPASQKSDDAQNKANRRRFIDFSRRRTVAGIGERNTDKENLVKRQPKPAQDIYQFTPSSSNHQLEIQPSAVKHTTTKKYYFHSQANEDLLNNSYGLTLLQQKPQPPTKPLQQRHSVAAVLMISQLPKKITAVRPPPAPVPDSLDDLLCDQEVESYFYPVASSLHSDHVYMNVTTPPNQYYSSIESSSAYMHGTLC